MSWPGRPLPQGQSYDRVPRRLDAPSTVLFDHEGQGLQPDQPLSVDVPASFADLHERPAVLVAELATGLARELGRGVEDAEMLAVAEEIHTAYANDIPLAADAD